jgi:hypothetical protein
LRDLTTREKTTMSDQLGELECVGGDERMARQQTTPKARAHQLDSHVLLVPESDVSRLLAVTVPPECYTQCRHIVPAYVLQ